MKIIDNLIQFAQNQINFFENLETSKQLEIIGKVALAALGSYFVVSFPTLFVIGVTLGTAIYYCSKEKPELAKKVSDFANPLVLDLVS